MSHCKNNFCKLWNIHNYDNKHNYQYNQNEKHLVRFNFGQECAIWRGQAKKTRGPSPEPALHTYCETIEFNRYEKDEKIDIRRAKADIRIINKFHVFDFFGFPMRAWSRETREKGIEGNENRDLWIIGQLNGEKILPFCWKKSWNHQVERRPISCEWRRYSCNFEVKLVKN